MHPILKTLLTHPLMQDANLDEPQTIMRVSEIIQNKPFLKQLYHDWYSSISQVLPDDVSGPVLELGSGGGFLEKYISNLITSEILSIPDVNIVLDAHFLPFTKDSLRSIVMLDVFHHLSDVKRFFKEASRCTQNNGRIIMIEPWVTCWSKFVYTHLHHEPIDCDSDQWTFPKGGPLSQANSALPWIVFGRDKIKFIREFPDWEIVNIHLHSPFAYLLSGGVSLRNIFPASLFNACRVVENVMQPWMASWAMFATIVLGKKESIV